MTATENVAVCVPDNSTLRDDLVSEWLGVSAAAALEEYAIAPPSALVTLSPLDDVTLVWLVEVVMSSANVRCLDLVTVSAGRWGCAWEEPIFATNVKFLTRYPESGTAK